MLANEVCQLAFMYLTHSLRQQAGSYRGLRHGRNGWSFAADSVAELVGGGDFDNANVCTSELPLEERVNAANSQPFLLA